MLKLFAALALAGATFACAEPNDEAAPSPDAATTSASKVERLQVVDESIALHGGERVANAEVSLTINSKSGSFDDEDPADIVLRLKD